MIFKVKGAAKSLFDIWVENAKQHHANYLFHAKDESLTDDLVVAFAKGLELIWRNENRVKHNTPGWSVGVFFDTVSATLNTHWSQEYIYKQTPEYQKLSFIKTLSQFLKVDAITLKKLESLHWHMMKREHIIEQKLEKDKVIDLHQFKKSRKSGTAFQKNITAYLDSIYYEKHFLIFGDILKNKSRLIVADFFDKDEIKILIDSVKKT